MARRESGPEEALGPQLDGLKELERLAMEALSAAPPQPVEEPEPEPEPLPAPVALVCGLGPEASALACLAYECGFDIDAAAPSPAEELERAFPMARTIIPLDDLDNMVEKCAIDGRSYICVFLEEPEACERILWQCLSSDAAYIGCAASRAKRDAIFRALRNDGAPDAELAALCCPIGLNIGAQGPEQLAVAIVAEMLAFRAGALSRLRHD